MQQFFPIIRFLPVFFLLVLSGSDLFAQCVSGTTVSLRNRAQEILICPGDGQSDQLLFRSSFIASKYGYVITNERDEIIDMFLGIRYNFDPLPVGVCRVWGFSFQGVLKRPIGESIHNAVLSDFCYEVSDNFVTITKAIPEGGTVSSINGPLQVVTCTGDGEADIISFNTTSSYPNYRYIITDENDIIMAVLSGNTADFEGMKGKFRIYGAAVQGTVRAQIGDHIFETTLSDGCNGLSGNFVEVNSTNADGGTISSDAFSDGQLVCVGDGQPDLVPISSESGSDANYIFVITNQAGNIVSFNESGLLDLDVFPTGVCQIRGLSFLGNIVADIGDPLLETELSDGCYDLSDNFLEFEKGNLNAGMITTIDGETEVFVCSGDDRPDNIVFQTDQEPSTGQLRYMVTNEDDFILAILADNDLNFEGIPTGICRMYAAVYDGNLTITVGENIKSTPISDNCYALTENFVAVNRGLPDGGRVYTFNFLSEIFICVTGGDVQSIGFEHTGAVTSDYAYLIVNDQKEIIGILDNSSDFTFDGSYDSCFVYGLSFTGNIIADVGDNIFQDSVILSDDCYSLSANFVTVHKHIDGPICFKEDQPEVGQSRMSPLQVQSIDNQPTLKVNPNPVDWFVQLSFGSSKEEGSIQVYNSLGTLMTQQTTAPYSSNLRLETAHWKGGIYFLIFERNGQRVVKKLIKGR